MNKELDEFLAVEGMGWNIYERFAPTISLAEYRDVEDKFVMSCEHWHPSTDLNQCAMVEGKVIEIDYFNYYKALTEVVIGKSKEYEACVGDLLKLITATAAQRCEAMRLVLESK